VNEETNVEKDEEMDLKAGGKKSSKNNKKKDSKGGKKNF
jgi:hypothetical protein